MRKIFTLLFCFFTIIVVKAQDRVNEVPYTFERESGLVTNIVGWKYNIDEGKWLSNKNFIYHYNLPIKNYGVLAKGIDNIQVKTFVHNNEIKYVLILAYNDGHYKYPNIRKEWVSYTCYRIFSLTKEQLDVILNPIEYKSLVLPCIDVHSFEIQNENLIIRQIIKNDKEFYEYEKDLPFNFSLCIHSLKISIKKWKDVVRFNYFGGSNDDILMEKSYFEIPINEWNKLNIIN